jgi:hypothetical protein
MELANPEDLSSVHAQLPADIFTKGAMLRDKSQLTPVPPAALIPAPFPGEREIPIWQNRERGAGE